MTAPVFDPTPDVVIAATYFKEILDQSTPENRVGMMVRWDRFDGGPLHTDNPNFRYWTIVPAPNSDWAVDLCYDAIAVHDFIPYDPDPSAALPTGQIYPYGERKERVVTSRKSKDALKEVVLAQRGKANSMLFPQDGVIDILADIIRIRSLSVVSSRDQARLDNYAPIEQARSANMDNAEEMLAAIESEQDFDITAGWTPDASTWTSNGSV
jgi:hypothetical protein